MSKIIKFFVNLKATGAPDSNAAIQAFENDNNKISISFIKRIRNEKKFKNLNELKKQLIIDKKKAELI